LTAGNYIAGPTSGQTRGVWWKSPIPGDDWNFHRPQNDAVWPLHL